VNDDSHYNPCPGESKVYPALSYLRDPETDELLGLVH